ncbi:MAG TPA: peptidoglycan-binding protein [Acidimicrobiia bacterium]|nr:peptidoglycan-binding protein [Acidimicrobiia bacterium]
MPAPLQLGGHGEAVRDLQQRLVAFGSDIAPDDAGAFGVGTQSAVRAFQEARGLRVDGVVGRETWSALVESGLTLGDRLLYRRRPMQRGDDVLDLQGRLNALGFHAGREDGIFGDATREALSAFQRDAGLPPDGMCGSTTVAALRRVGTMSEGSVATVREREALRRAERHLVGRKVYVAAAPGLAVLGEQVTRGLLEAGSRALLDTSGADDSLLAIGANRFEADLFLGLRLGDDVGCHCAFFASGRFRSEAGHTIAHAIHDELDGLLPREVTVSGKAYAALRETRMAAVVCEVVPDGDVDAMRRLVADAHVIALAIVRGIRRAIEERPSVDA